MNKYPIYMKHLNILEHEMTGKNPATVKKDSKDSEEVLYLRSRIASLESSHNMWRDRYMQIASEYNNLLEKLENSTNLDQDDIRRVFNRILKATGNKPLSIARKQDPKRFLTAVSNHLFKVLSKDAPVDELPA